MKKHFIFSFLIALCITQRSKTASAQNVDVLTRQAMIHYESQRPEQAGDLLRQSVSSQPSPDSYFFLGRYFLLITEPDSAQLAFQQGLDLDTKNYLNKIGLGGVALLRGQSEEAKIVWAEVEKKAKRKHPDWLHRLAEMNILIDGKQDPDEAIRLIDKVLRDEKVDKKAEYYTVKGDALRLKNQSAAAVSAYESALLINTQKPHDLTGIGLVFKKSRNYKKAYDYFVRALSVDSTYTPAYENLGDLYMLGPNYRLAAFNYKKMVDNSEPTDSTLLRYTKLAFLSEDYTNMIDYLEKVRDQSTLQNSNETWRMRAYAYLSDDFKKYDEALTLMQDVLRSTKEEERLAMDYAALGRAYANRNDTTTVSDSLALIYLTKAAADTSRNYYDEIAQIHYKDFKNYRDAALTYEQSIRWKENHHQRIMGQDYYNLGRSAYLGYAIGKDSAMLPKADAAFARLTEVNPSFDRGTFWRARVNRYMPDDGAGRRAITYYQSFIANADTSKITKQDLVEAHSFIGYQYYREKEIAQAIPYLQKTLELDPTNHNVQQLLDYIDKRELVADTKKETTADSE
ncbi:tetratricopeptide repeat protein [Larkinella harenae]